MALTLDQIAVHQIGTVKQIAANGLSSKLTEMGLYPGKQVKVLFRAPFGDPIAIDVEGYILSLRKREASFVELEDRNTLTENGR
jgi:Fe2+ transport system protein FeoA